MRSMFKPPAASMTSAVTDFDFLLGRWTVQNRRLRQRLVQPPCTDWDEFPATIALESLLFGQANLERYAATIGNAPYQGVAIRLFDASSKLWTIYWLSSTAPAMDTHPVVGSFDGATGRFYARHSAPEREVIVLYQWDKSDLEHPVWSQACSLDEGQRWEWNWIMELSRDARPT
jgi:hypothetical protein